jgi:hypothetical protein
MTNTGSCTPLPTPPNFKEKNSNSREKSTKILVIIPKIMRKTPALYGSTGILCA